jgi:D-sedoheptulose 7-phosphate isomerase
MKHIQEYIDNLGLALNDFKNSQIYDAIGLLESAHATSRNVFIIANGGSAAFSLHWEVDWTKGIYIETGQSLKTRALVGMTGLFSACSNDYGWEVAFSKMIEMIALPEDILVAVSSSGRSKNILNASEKARELGMSVIGLAGFGSSPLNDLSDFPVSVHSQNMQIIEDVHNSFGHLVLHHFGANCVTA